MSNAQFRPQSIPAAREFVRQLPPPSAAPFIVVNDYTPATEREEILNALADEGAQTKTVRTMARWTLEQLTLRLRRAPSDLEFAQALLDTIHALVEYGDDPEPVEQYSRAVTSLMPVEGMPVSPITGKPKGRGDCDDLAVLFSALARAAGLNSDVIWVDQPGADYNHVAAVLCQGRGEQCYWVETTIPGAKVGETTAEVMRRLRVTGRKDI
jgi:transglutaminase-like putative cysteine protease